MIILMAVKEDKQKQVPNATNGAMLIAGGRVFCICFDFSSQPLTTQCNAAGDINHVLGGSLRKGQKITLKSLGNILGLVFKTVPGF